MKSSNLTFSLGVTMRDIVKTYIPMGFIILAAVLYQLKVWPFSPPVDRMILLQVQETKTDQSEDNGIRQRIIYSGVIPAASSRVLIDMDYRTGQSNVYYQEAKDGLPTKDPR